MFSWESASYVTAYAIGQRLLAINTQYVDPLLPLLREPQVKAQIEREYAELVEGKSKSPLFNRKQVDLHLAPCSNGCSLFGWFGFFCKFLSVFTVPCELWEFSREGRCGPRLIWTV